MEEKEDQLSVLKDIRSILRFFQILVQIGFLFSIFSFLIGIAIFIANQTR